MQIETVILKRHRAEIDEAVDELVDATGWEPWFAQNIVVWRLRWKLPIRSPRTL